MPYIPTSNQSQFLEKSKQDLTNEFKRKDEKIRIEKHHKRATSGSQFMHNYEHNWFWDFWSMTSIQERWAKRDKDEHPTKRALIREFIDEFEGFKMIVMRLLERKVRRNENACINDVLDTIISSYRSYSSHSRF